MPEPPKPRTPGSPPLVAKELDRTLYGADQQARADNPRRRTSPGLAPPALPLEHQATVRAPEAWDRKQTRQRPPPPSTMRRATPSLLPALPRPGAWSSGYEAQGQPSDAPTSVAPDTVHGPRRKGELERDRRAAAEAQQETYPPKVVESSRPPAEPKPKAAPADDDPSPKAWRAALFKLLVAAGAFLTAATAYLSLRTASVEPKVAAQEVRVKATETTQDTLVDRVAKLEAYARAETKRRQCVEAQLRDALARGTGHVLTTLPATATPWSEQNAPKNEPRLYWKTPTWFTTEGCDAAPAPP
jgi:hypothetical protein